MYNFRKPKLISCLCVIMSTALFLTSFASASKISDTTTPEMSLQDIFNEVLIPKVSESDLNQTKHFYNVKRFKEIVKCKYSEMSDMELAKSIRLLLGENKDVIEQMPDEVVLASLNNEEVIVQESYLKTDINGKAEFISKEQLEKDLNEIKQNNPSELLLMPESNALEYNTLTAEKEYTYPFPNGYMQITTRAYRIVKHANDETWLLSGEALWLKGAYNRMTDMLTIGSSALYDSDYSYYEYGYKSGYRNCVGAASGYITHKYAQTCYNTISTEYTSGCGYSIKSPLYSQLCYDSTWSYPGYGSYHTVKQDHSHRYYAQYCVNTTGNFNVLVAYGHRVWAVGGVSASISTSGSGSIGISFNIGTEEYISQPLLVKPSEYK